jgi:hypothetical protein
MFKEDDKVKESNDNQSQITMIEDKVLGLRAGRSLSGDLPSGGRPGPSDPSTAT